jgi:hypothetical protein
LTAFSDNPRYYVIESGYWSYIIDSTTNKVVSHGYDILADAELECERKNNDDRPMERNGPQYFTGEGTT